MNEPRERLLLLMDEKNLTKGDIAKLCNISPKVVQNFRSGITSIPYDVAIQIADKYNVTLDWLYGRTETRTDSDTLVDILLALDKVFRFTHRRDIEGNYYPVLLVDKTFYNFISETHNLITCRDDLDEVEIRYRRKKIFSKYREYFNHIVNNACFNEDQALEIRDYEGLSIVDLLATAAI